MRRLSLALVLLAVAFLVGDRLLAAFWLPRYWRPLPPFGALTNDAQRAWAERERAEIERGEPEHGTGAFDAELGWTNRPSSASPDGRVHIDARGFRGTRTPSERPAPGTTRVATFGDSFTFCQEVADQDAWQAQLEERDPALEVLNLGVGGYGTDQALLRARRELPALHADVAWIGLLLENIGRNVNRYRPLWYPGSDVAVTKPRFVLRDGRLELVAQPFATRAELIAAVLDGSVLERAAEHEHWSARYVPGWLGWCATARLLGGRRAYLDRELPPLYAEREGEPFRVTLALLEAFAALAREQGIERCAVLVFAMEQDLARPEPEGERYWDGLLEALAARGVPAIDLTLPLGRAHRAGRGRSLFTGSHLSREGNGLVAERLAAWLSSPDPLPRSRSAAGGPSDE